MWQKRAEFDNCSCGKQHRVRINLVVPSLYNILSFTIRTEWDVCKSPGVPSNRVAAGQVGHPLYESLWFVPCLLAVCLLLKRFFSSLARFAGSSATHTLRKNICWVFFVASDRRRAGVTRRRRPLVDCATPQRHLSKKRNSKSLGLNNVPALLKSYICVHGELFSGCAVRFAVKFSQEYCASEQWLLTQRTCEDCDRMRLKIEGLPWVGQK